jgi:hypothetical protein
LGLGYTPKNDLITVATTTKKTQEPNQAAATLPVSGSPLFHLLYTFANCIHEIRAGREISSHFSIGFINTGITILRITYNGNN